MVLGAAVLLGLGCSASVAQTAEPSYKADPDTYKVIFEDANYRVIEANHKKGIHDKGHSHPVSFVVVNLTDCNAGGWRPNQKTHQWIRQARLAAEADTYGLRFRLTLLGNNPDGGELFSS
jgi:hypothetical protein